MKIIYLYIRNVLAKIYLTLYKFYTLYINKYDYNAANYTDSFLSNVPKSDGAVLKKTDEVIYVFWTGTNELTANRKKGLASLKEKSDVKIKLVTPTNLNEYIVQGYPLHEGYPYLSLIQKSDYLRCYFMLHHGGGYADIKPCINSWKPLFKKLNDSNKWCIGIREKFIGGVPDMDGNIGIDCKKYHNILIGNAGGYIFKPNSAIAKEWIAEIHKRLDFYLSELKKHPGDAFGSGDYPIPWAYLAAHIMAPLVLKYNEKVIPVDIELFTIENYR
jgi:hypothetical protein